MVYNDVYLAGIYAVQGISFQSNQSASLNSQIYLQGIAMDGSVSDRFGAIVF